MDEPQRRQVVEMMVQEITVGEGSIHIKFCQLPAFEQMTERQRTV
jgi:hypothetical protein